jgi:electron transport complex protein RnfE
MELPLLSDYNVPLLTIAPGGFIVFGCLVAVVKKVTKKGKDFDCKNCSLAGFCGKNTVSGKGESKA